VHAADVEDLAVLGAAEQPVEKARPDSPVAVPRLAAGGGSVLRGQALLRLVPELVGDNAQFLDVLGPQRLFAPDLAGVVLPGLPDRLRLAVLPVAAVAGVGQQVADRLVGPGAGGAAGRQGDPRRVVEPATMALMERRSVTYQA
jgi:hypothetical protein